MSKSSKKWRDQLVASLQHIIPADLQPLLPHGWWKIGDILLVTISPELENYKLDIGSAMLNLIIPKVRTVLGKIGPTEGITREPTFSYLAGDTNTETIHKELGCKFKIDAAKLTFSPGNRGERKRLLDITNDNEIIIDMFACVGNLSLPLAVHKKPKQVIAAEINPYAYKYLNENITLNKLDHCMKAILGDNRETLIDFEGHADRVISGYFQSDMQQIRQAIKLCKPNAIYHYHEATPSRVELQERPIERIKQAARDEKREIEIITKRQVKKYSPGVEHIVVDAKII